MANQAPILPQPTPAGTPRSQSALDRDAPAGRGGDGAAQGQFIVLFSFVSDVTLQDTDLNNLASTQTQRIHSAATRATQELRRATPHPAAAVYLASGQQGHPERRPTAKLDAQAGAQRTLQRATGHAAQGSELPRSARNSAHEDAQRGIRAGQGARASLNARVAYARPNVDRGPAATLAEQHDPKVRDNVDAELLAAALERSIVDASHQRATRTAAGQGGADAPTERGYTQHGAHLGARARPYSPGFGNAGALDTGDHRYIRWFTEQKARVQAQLVFPHARALAKDQGVTIYRVVVRANGQLASSPHLVRSSGFADFDAAAAHAIRQALPFHPLPAQLLASASELTVLIPVAFANPMVP